MRLRKNIKSILAKNIVFRLFTFKVHTEYKKANNNKEAVARKDLLTELINSLSVNEKRYFSLFSSVSPGEQNFKKLFKALDGETAYDSKKIQQKLGPTRMNVAYEKGYLQKVILKSLRNYNEDATDEIALHAALIDIEILFNKQQYQLALNLIKKALRDAERKEKFAFQLQLIGWEKRCMLRMGEYEYFEKQFTQSLNRERELIALLENFSQYRTLQYYMLALVSRKGNVTRAGDRKKFDAIMKHPLMKSAALAKSFLAKLLYYEILEHWYHHHFEVKKAYDTTRQVLQLFEQNPEQIEQNPQAYYSFVSNYFNRALALDKMEQANEAISKIEWLIDTFSGNMAVSQQAEMKATLIERKLIYFVFTSNYKMAADYAESLLPEVEKSKNGFRQAFYVIFYFYASLSFFHLKNFEKALDYQRKIIDRFDDTVRMDFVFMTHILHFITHFELKHYSMLPYLQKSVQRFMQTRGLGSKANHIILRFFAELIKAANNEQKLRETMRNFHQQLHVFKNDHSQNLVLETLDLLNWMEGKGKG